MLKICTKCKKEKDISEFYKQKRSKDGFSYWCKECFNKQNLKYQLRNKDQQKEYNKKYQLRNKDKVKKYNKKYQLSNKNELNKQRKEYNKEKIKNLKDSYIKQAIREQTSLKTKEVTQEMIDDKRQLILTHRIIKEIKSECNRERID